MVAVDGDVLTGLLIVRTFQRKQTSQLAFLSIEQVAQVIRRVIRAHDRIADHSAGNRKPGNEVLVLGQARLQINAGIDNSLSIRGGRSSLLGIRCIG